MSVLREVYLRLFIDSKRGAVFINRACTTTCYLLFYYLLLTNDVLRAKCCYDCCNYSMYYLTIAIFIVRRNVKYLLFRDKEYYFSDIEVAFETVEPMYK